MVLLFNYSLTTGGISLIAFPMFGWLLWKFNKPIIQHQQKDEMAVIFITHRRQTALLADKIYILEGGIIKSEEFTMVLN